MGMQGKKISGDRRWFFYTPGNKAGYHAFPGGQYPPRCSLIDMDNEVCHQATFVPAIIKADHNVHCFLEERGLSLQTRAPERAAVPSRHYVDREGSHVHD